MTAPTDAARWPDAPRPATDHVLTPGYYQLTLIAAALAGCAELHLRAGAGLPSVSVLELVVAPAFLSLVVEILSRRRLRAQVAALYHRNRALAGYGAYAAVASFVGLVRTTDTVQSFHDLFVALALYALVGLTVDDLGRLRGLLAAALVGVAINVALAVLQVGAGGPYPISLSENIDAKLDLAGELARSLPTGLFNHPNGLAMFLLPVVVFLVVGSWAGFQAAPRRAAWIAAVLVPTLFVLRLTYAKGVYAWLAAGAVFLVLPRWFDRHRVWLAVAAVVGGITALTWLSIDAFLSGELVFATIVSRIELWLATLHILRSDSFVAVFGSGGMQLIRQPLVTFEYTNTHNAWLDQALTYGIPALVFYLGAYLTALRSLARQIRSERPPIRTVALASFASLVGFLGESFFEPTNHSLALQVELFLVLGIAAALPACRPYAERAGSASSSPR